ncbi:MAG: DUF2259 domain-containing protein [Spirochaetaceae bacterium]|jgi:predicted secreted protein|nr:DUF2259 domain-containing protein [Spirochaetaceae bacterium]
MPKRSSLKFCCVLFFFTVSCLGAGDVASFADLGFAENGKIYMFGQYGVNEKTLKPWADLNIVDVNTNEFVDGGKVSYIHDKKIDAGQDGSGALMRLVSRNSGLIQRYGTNFMTQGIPLFISLEDWQNQEKYPVTFRDFDYGETYRASLKPVFLKSGGKTVSSFYIVLEKTNSDGSVKTYRVGNPGVKRTNVTSYTIKKVVVNQERTSMILIIEMTIQNASGPDIRYMVEAVRL